MDDDKQKKPSEPDAEGSSPGEEPEPEIILEADPLTASGGLSAPPPPRPKPSEKKPPEEKKPVAEPAPAAEPREEAPAETAKGEKPPEAAPAVEEKKAPEARKPAPPRPTPPAPKKTEDGKQEETAEEAKARQLAERGDVLRQEAQYGRALQSYQDALAIVPEHPAAQAGIALIASMRDQLKQRLEELILNVRNGSERLEAAVGFDLSGFDPHWPEVAKFRKDLEVLREEIETRKAKGRKRLIAVAALILLLPVIGAGGYIYFAERKAFDRVESIANSATGAELDQAIAASREYLDTYRDASWAPHVAEVEALISRLTAQIELRDFERVRDLADSAEAEERTILAACEQYLRTHPHGANAEKVQAIREATQRAGEADELRQIASRPIESQEDFAAILADLKAFSAKHPDAAWRSALEAAEDTVRQTWYERSFDQTQQEAERLIEAGNWIEAAVPWSAFLGQELPEDWAARAKEELAALRRREADTKATEVEAQLESGGLSNEDARSLCRDFLSRYGDTEAAKRIEQRMAALQSEEERSEYEALMAELDRTEEFDQIDTLIQGYLTRHPRSSFRNEIQGRLDRERELRDDPDFELALQEATLAADAKAAAEAIERLYLSRHPGGKHVAEANQIVSNGIERTERRLFERIETAYRTRPMIEKDLLDLTAEFTALYPTSASAGRVNNVRRAAERAAEDRVFETAKSALDRGDHQLALNLLNDYLSTYPNGQHTAEINVLIRTAKEQLENLAWERADELFEARDKDPKAFLDHLDYLRVRFAGDARLAALEQREAVVRREAADMWLARARDARQRFDWEVVAACAVRALQFDPGREEAIRLREDAVSNGRLTPGGPWSLGVLPPRFK